MPEVVGEVLGMAKSAKPTLVRESDIAGIRFWRALLASGDLAATFMAPRGFWVLLFTRLEPLGL